MKDQTPEPLAMQIARHAPPLDTRLIFRRERDGSFTVYHAESDKLDDCMAIKGRGLVLRSGDTITMQGITITDVPGISRANFVFQCLSAEGNLYKAFFAAADDNERVLKVVGDNVRVLPGQLYSVSAFALLVG